MYQGERVKKANRFLVFGGALSAVAALLHVAIVIGGPQWYRFFGAGEELATMVEKGSWYPAVLTFGIAVVLLILALYAFSGAGLIRRLPLLKVGLVVISAIYLIRGIAFIPAYIVKPEIVDEFLVWSSFICLVYGFAYTMGTKQVWAKLSAN